MRARDEDEAQATSPRPSRLPQVSSGGVCSVCRLWILSQCLPARKTPSLIPNDAHFDAISVQFGLSLLEEEEA
jgi:hypothetical protein